MSKKKEETTSTGQSPDGLLCCKTTIKPIQITTKRIKREIIYGGFPPEPSAREKPLFHLAKMADSAKKLMLSVSRNLIQLFIELEKMDDVIPN